MVNFYMLVGVPGCGKSTYAEQLAEQQNAIVFSSDAIRGELYGDESCQADPARVFDIMYTRTIEALKRGQSVIYDATNLNRKKRINLLKSLPECNKLCKIMWAPYEVCVLRDGARERKVGSAVIKKMVMNFQTPFWDEGWDSIEIVYTSRLRCSLSHFDFSLDHANPHHTGTIQEHIDDVIRLINEKEGELGAAYTDLALLAKYHDMGKPFTRTFINTRGVQTDIAHYYQHENAGAYFCLGLFVLEENLTPTELLKLSWLIGLHMEYHAASQSKYYKKLKEPYASLLKMFGDFDSEAC